VRMLWWVQSFRHRDFEKVSHPSKKGFGTRPPEAIDVSALADSVVSTSRPPGRAAGVRAAKPGATGEGIALPGCR
jgi:hypothetical protein